MNRYEILDNSETIELKEIESYLISFIQNCVQKDRQKRWLEMVNKPDKLNKKFNGLWNSINFEKVNEYEEDLNLKSNSYYYFCMDHYAYKVNKEEAYILSESYDGFLFSRTIKETYFLTHENIKYEQK